MIIHSRVDAREGMQLLMQRLEGFWNNVCVSYYLFYLNLENHI
jgi:hypothetical protein